MHARRHPDYKNINSLGGFEYVHGRKHTPPLHITVYTTTKEAVSTHKCYFCVLHIDRLLGRFHNLRTVRIDAQNMQFLEAAHGNVGRIGLVGSHRHHLKAHHVLHSHVDLHMAKDV